MGEKCSDKFRLRIRLPRNSRDLLHATNLRHGTDGFTSPRKEGVLKIFFIYIYIMQKFSKKSASCSGEREIRREETARDPASCKDYDIKSLW